MNYCWLLVEFLKHCFVPSSCLGWNEHRSYTSVCLLTLKVREYFKAILHSSDSQRKFSSLASEMTRFSSKV